tara:strand:- start:168 stop:368 length:201 start_codon:yes stop_codon:yes gene_type:complete
MKILITILLALFISSNAYADKYQISSATEYKVWVVNTKTGEVKQCLYTKYNADKKPSCSNWSDEDE